MYVCVCNAVTQQQIMQAIADGADTLAQLQEELKVTGCCGMCIESVQKCLNVFAVAE
jgi:bacterioferritin-associated ferredoxin